MVQDDLVWLWQVPGHLMMAGQKQIKQLYLDVKENELSTDDGLNLLIV